MKVILSSGVMAVAQQLATIRTTSCRLAELATEGKVSKNSKVGKLSDYTMDLDGVVAELAYGQWKNLWPDLTAVPRRGGVDFIENYETVDVRTTKTVDVKSTRKFSSDLYVPEWKTEEGRSADIYVLAHVDENVVTFIGWTTKEFVFKKEHHVPSMTAYVVRQFDLNRYLDENGNPPVECESYWPEEESYNQQGEQQ